MKFKRENGLWIVTHTHDGANYKETEIEGKSYTDAFVNFQIAYPGETVCEIKAVRDGLHP